ncbi:hypothetical protein P3S67_008215 [Capsicum chacoense]
MAHASVASLMRTIESLLTSNSPMQSLICDHREELCALREKVSSLEVFVKNFEKNNVSGEMTDFEVEVKEVASAAENTIQLRLTETVLGENKSIRGIIGTRFFKGILIYGHSESKQDGIGKTTLAKEVYNNESILRRFDVRAWATVSQQHNIKEILQTLLKSTIKMDDTVKTEVEAELADMLQKSLKRKRYLIVLDDIWSCEVWDGVSRCFPTDENAGSRILLTTRNNEVARNAGTEYLSMQMNFMDQDESWNLFKSAAFSNEALSSLFETIGKQIAEKCHGLPLTIVVVAGLLKSKRAIEDWGSVAKDVTSFITNDPDEQCSHVLGLSYNHLTSDLKTCLLHFGIFPEDSEVPAKRLVRSWMAEGFLKLENDLEGEAEKCLQELVDRCLVLVCKKSLGGTKNRSCKVHDLIYHLCVREIQMENIFIMNDIVLDYSYSDSERRYLTMQKMQPFKRVTGDKIDYCPHGLYRALLTPVHHQLRDHDNNDLMKRTRSIFSFHLKDLFFVLKSELIHFKLLKVLELRNIDMDHFPVQPNLVETFIVQGPSLWKITFPEEILGLMQLRHLELPAFYLPNPPSVSADKGSHMGFSNIQTISYLSPCCCTKEFIMRIQKVKELGISAYQIDSDGLPLNNLVHLQQLETLSLSDRFGGFWPASAKAFPATLKKLKLE